VLGHHWSKGPWLSLATRKHARLASVLCTFARQELPGVQFTSIQVNKDYRAALHVDKNNLGPSWIIGLGNYSGGRLWMDNGSRVGRAVDIRGRWLEFDGNQPHCVLPFHGRRYTIVYFTYCHPKLCRPVLPWVQERLAGLGFPLPREVQAPRLRRFTAEREVQERLLGARQVFKRFQARVLARGSIDGVRLRIRDPSGRAHHVAVSPTAPLQHLVDALRKRLRPTASGEPQAIHLAVGSLRLLPGDTPESLGLDAKQAIDVHGLEESAPCACGKWLDPQGSAPAAAKVHEPAFQAAEDAECVAGKGEFGTSRGADGDGLPNAEGGGFKRRFSLLGA